MNDSMTPQYSELSFQHFKLATSILCPNYQQQILLLHGGARAQDVFIDLRKILAQDQIGSVALDCIGHGQSTGNLSDSSLALRSAQALYALKHHQTMIQSCLGVSMGGYNALKLSQQLPLNAMILIVPGVYTPDAYHVNFGKQFSHIIRQPNSWFTSDAWEIIQNFKGNLLIVSAEKDEIVPSDIPQKLFESATQCKWKHHLIIPNASHQGIIQYILNSEQIKNEFMFYFKKCLFNE